MVQTANNFTGRHIFVVPRAAPLTSRLRNISKPRRVMLGIWRMFTVYPYWDVSWLIGVSFTIGCLLFVASGLFAWLPIAYPETKFPHEKDLAAGLTAFVGATLFQVGAFLLLLEAYNDRAETKFGGAVETWFTQKFKPKLGAMSNKEENINSSNPLDPESPEDDSLSSAAPVSDDKVDTLEKNKERPAGARHKSMSQNRVKNDDPFGEREWQWLPSWNDVKTHYIFEIGFLASAVMSLGATIFYICGILSLPGIELTKVERQGAYYFPYVFGGVLFATSSILYILETQPNWYTPQPFNIGWHIGVFNFIGGVGWTLAAAFGFCDPYWCKYQSELSLIWASCAFSFGSALQWYESLDKYVFVIED